MLDQTLFHSLYVAPRMFIEMEEVYEQEREGRPPPSIIAMKGQPCTGKSTIAWPLAQLLEHSFVSLDDVRDSLVNVLPLFPDLATSLSASAVSECIDDLAYQTVCRIVSAQLQRGTHLVIDCPLSCRSHLDQLLQLSTSEGARLAVIECKPHDEYEQQKWLQQRVQRQPEKYEDYDDGDINKLFINTTAPHVYIFDVLFAVIGVAASKRVRHVDLHQWVAGGYKPIHRDLTPEEEKENEERRERNRNPHFNNHAHNLKTINLPKEDEEMIICHRCLKPISSDDEEISCTLCVFSLHRSCAETPNRLELSPDGHLPFLKPMAEQYSFPNTYSCSSEQAFSYDCSTCLFLTNIRCGFLPSVLQHRCHQHLLVLKMERYNHPFEYQCSACDKNGSHISYSCFQCNVHVHAQCAFLPFTSKHRYHRHDLLLTSTPSLQEQELEDEFYCDICESRRNPRCWKYYCAECDYATHLDCANSMA